MNLKPTTFLLDSHDRNGHPSSIAVEQVAFNEHDLDLDNSVVDHIHSCPQCRHRVDTLRQEREAFRVLHPSAAFVARLEEETNTGRTGNRRWSPRVGISGLALASALGAAVFLVAVQPDNPSAPTGVKMKGATRLALHIHVSRGGGPAIRFDARDELRRGDILRFVVDAPVDGYAALLSLDERQQLSWYLPTSASAARLLPAGLSRPLPGAIQLDDYVGHELLIFILTKAPIDRQAIEAHVRKVITEANGDLKALHRRGFGANSVSLLVRKGPSP